MTINRFTTLFAVRIAMSLVIAMGAAEYLNAGDDPIVPADAKLEMLYDKVDFAEGPAAAPDGDIYFSDIPTGEKPGRILRFRPSTRSVEVFRADSHKSNGLDIDAKGALVACEGADFGGRRIARYRLDGKYTPVVERYQKNRFRAPNDLSIDAAGRIWFTDPHYVGKEPLEIQERSVYRIDRDGATHRVLTQPLIQKPNGIQVAPNQQILYVADTNNDPQLDGSPGNMQLVAFVIGADGSLAEKRVLVDFKPENGVDGMTVDQAGNIYAAVRSKSAPGIRIYTPDGNEIGRIATPGPPTNCVFGRGGEANRLYVTMDNGFGRVRLNAIGYHLPSE